MFKQENGQELFIKKKKKKDKKQSMFICLEVF
jgi:hypothetical protein